MAGRNRSPSISYNKWLSTIACFTGIFHEEKIVTNVPNGKIVKNVSKLKLLPTGPSSFLT
jgi:hypothetical protein